MYAPLLALLEEILLMRLPSGLRAQEDQRRSPSEHCGGRRRRSIDGERLADISLLLVRECGHSHG